MLLPSSGGSSVSEQSDLPGTREGKAEGNESDLLKAVRDDLRLRVRLFLGEGGRSDYDEVMDIFRENIRSGNWSMEAVNIRYLDKVMASYLRWGEFGKVLLFMIDLITDGSEVSRQEQVDRQALAKKVLKLLRAVRLDEDFARFELELLAEVKEALDIS